MLCSQGDQVRRTTNWLRTRLWCPRHADDCMGHQPCSTHRLTPPAQSPADMPPFPPARNSTHTGETARRADLCAKRKPQSSALPMTPCRHRRGAPQLGSAQFKCGGESPCRGRRGRPIGSRLLSVSPNVRRRPQLSPPRQSQQPPSAPAELHLCAQRRRRAHRAPRALVTHTRTHTRSSSLSLSLSRLALADNKMCGWSGCATAGRQDT